jgi:membrane-bound ClpP family serine protease
MPVTVYGANNIAHHRLNANFNVVESKGKGKSREADFEAAFAQIAASLTPAQAEVSGLVEIDDAVTDIEELLKNVSLNVSESDVERGTDFQKCATSTLSLLHRGLLYLQGLGSAAEVRIATSEGRSCQMGSRVFSVDECPTGRT